MRRLLPLVLAPLALSACEETNTYVEPPPPRVTVAAPAVMEVTDYFYFTGTTQAAAIVDVRARVPGYLESMAFTSGTYVAAGDPLFIIDQREYKADLKIARAELESAKAQKVEADKSLARARELIKRGNISQARLDEAEATALSAAADVSVKEAALQQAQLNLEYTEIRAPIDGRIGRNLVDVGNLVGEDGATLLATITANDPMYVYFNINERDLLRVREEARKAGGSDTPRRPGDFQVEMAIGGEEDYRFVGRLDFAASALDSSTGTLQLRAHFDNPAPQRELLSGLFAHIRVPVATRPDMPLVTERAIGLDQAGRYLYVLGTDNTVEKRSVEVGQLTDGLRVIESGLESGEKVVVNGLQRVRDGSRVDPEESQMSAFSTSALVAAEQSAAKQSAEGKRGQTAEAGTPAEAETTE